MIQEAKIKLNNTVSTYCLFFRKLTEKALNDYYYFFDKYKSNIMIYDELHDKYTYTRDLIYDKEDDIQFLFLFLHMFIHLYR